MPIQLLILLFILALAAAVTDAGVSYVFEIFQSIDNVMKNYLSTGLGAAFILYSKLSVSTSIVSPLIVQFKNKASWSNRHSTKAPAMHSGLFFISLFIFLISIAYALTISLNLVTSSSTDFYKLLGFTLQIILLYQLITKSLMVIHSAWTTAEKILKRLYVICLLSFVFVLILF